MGGWGGGEGGGVGAGEEFGNATITGTIPDSESVGSPWAGHLSACSIMIWGEGEVGFD